MKKIVFGFLTAATMTFTLASCGEKLLTPEQINAKIEEGFAAQKVAAEANANAACDANFEARITAEVDRLTAEAKAAMEAAKAAMPAAAPAKKK